MTYKDTNEPCKDCDEGTYVEYVDGIRCRSCGQTKPEPRPKSTARKKTNE